MIEPAFTSVSSMKTKTATRSQRSAACLLGFLAIVALGVSFAADDAPPLELHEWSVWVAEPQGKSFNAATEFPTAMPGLVESERSRKRDPDKPKPAPVSLMTLYGTPPEVADVDLKISAGRPISQWPRSEGKASRLRWLDLTLSKELINRETLAYIPETHWFHKARALEGLFIQLKKGGRAERFFAYDIELQTPLNIRLDGGPEQYQLANLSKHSLHDIMLIAPGKDGHRVGWLDTLEPTPGAAETGGNKPVQPAQANAQPAGAVVAVAAGANVVLAAPAAAAPVAAAPAAVAAPAGAPAAANQKPADAKPAEKPENKIKLPEIPLSGPLAVDSDEFRQKTDVEMRRRLTATGLKPGEVDLIMELYAPHFFATDEIHLVFRFSQPGLDELTPLSVEPDTTKIKRVALVIARRVDPRHREDVQKLITELADASYSKREETEKKLKELGNLAIPNLKEAMKSTDLEVVMRAERILLSHKEQLPNEQNPAQ